MTAQLPYRINEPISEDAYDRIGVKSPSKRGTIVNHVDLDDASN